MITTQNTESIDTSFISYSVRFTIVSDVRIFSNSWIVASLHLKIYILETTYTPIMKYKDLNVFSTSLTYLVKSICCLTFYLIKYSKSTSQFLIYNVPYLLKKTWTYLDSSRTRIPSSCCVAWPNLPFPALNLCSWMILAMLTSPLNCGAPQTEQIKANNA